MFQPMRFASKLRTIGFTQALDTMSEDARDTLAIALVRAALKCVEGWPWGRLVLLKFESCVVLN
jgi:hypothetical protein